MAATLGFVPQPRWGWRGIMRPAMAFYFMGPAIPPIGIGEECAPGKAGTDLRAVRLRARRFHPSGFKPSRIAASPHSQVGPMGSFKPFPDLVPAPNRTARRSVPAFGFPPGGAARHAWARPRAPEAFSTAETFTARLRNGEKSVTSAVQMTLQTLEKNAMELPEDQRVTLAHRILRSTEPPKNPEVDALWEMEIARRIELLDSGGTGRHSAAEVFRALDRRLRQ